MKFFNNYKQEFSTLILLAFLHGFAFQALAITNKSLISNPHSRFLSYGNNSYANNSTAEVVVKQEGLIAEKDAVIINKNHNHPVVGAAKLDEASTTLYGADIAFGEIGRSQNTSYDSPEDNLFRLEIQEEIDFGATYSLSYEVYGIANAAGVTKSINTATSTGGFFIDRKEQWSRVTEFLSPYDLKKGVNTVLFTSDLTKDLGYLVRNVQFEKSKATVADLFFINDAVKSSEGKAVYVQGVLTIKDSNTRLFLDGREVAIKNNHFESLIPIDANQKNELVFELRRENQLLEKKSLAISQIKEVHHSKAVDQAFERSTSKITAREGKLYELENIAIELPEASYPSDFTLSIQELRTSDYAPTGMSMKNVTKNKAAYRFLPDGIKFEKDVKVKIKVDVNALPKAYGLKDVQVFYFDTTVKQWSKVKVVDILEETGEVVALTNHFTDYLAGVIQEPESPETNAFAPTTISGIQAANPTENISMVSVPQINDRGDASLNFPLMLPPARQGMTPDLSINYSSGSDEGDFGLGWNLSTKSIDIDTRWGVPIYDATKETESYLFNGEELLLVKSDKTMYAAHKDPLIPRLSDVKFQLMKHNPMLEITRKGSNLAYTWEVLDKKTGWRSLYESYSGGSWLLTSITDNYDNKIVYNYSRNELVKIVYNTNGQNSGNDQMEDLTVNILRKNTIDTPGKSRSDLRVSNRSGSSVMSKGLVDKIVIHSSMNEFDAHRSALIEYKFLYKEGQFGRSLLHNIVQSSYNNNERIYSDYSDYSNITPVVQTYSFDYHDDIGSGSLFETNGQSFKTYKDYETDYDNFKVFVSALGGGEGKSTGFVGGVSAGAVLPIFPASWLPFSRAATIGGNLSGGSSNSETKVLMTDIDGDGLPDKVFKGGDDFFYRKNLGTKFSTEIYSIKNLPNLNYSKSSSSDKSVSINIMMGSVSKSFSESVSSTSTYTTDVNGDGLLDVVDNERVYFGYIDPVTKEPTFNLDSSLTPAIVIKEDDVAPVLNPMPQLELTNGLMDVVMVWRAPKDGQIKIDGTISKQHINLQSGVKFSIEKLHDTDMGEASFIFGPYLMLSSSETHTQTLNVVKGDLIFFRTHSNQLPLQELGVTWNPRVQYLTQNFESSSGQSKYSSSFQESLIVGTNYEHAFKKSGNYRLEWPSFNFDADDNIKIRVSHFTKGASGGANVAVTGNNVVVYEKTSAINGTTTFASPNILLNMSGINNNPTTFQYVKVEVLSESEVNWKDIDAKFKPKLIAQDQYSEDVYLVPYYSNYSNVNTNYANSDFTNYTTANQFTINHNFSLPGCSQLVCEDRYVYLIIRWPGGRVVTFGDNNTTSNYAKFRYKINASGAIVQRAWLDANSNTYVSIGSSTTHGLGGFAGRKMYFEYYTSDFAIAEKLKTYQNTGSNYLVRANNETPKTDYIEGGNNNGMFKANIYSSEMNTAWGSMFRNWGQFAYRGAEVGEAYKPIVGDHIHLYDPNKTNSEGQTGKDILEDPNLTLEQVEADFDQIQSLGGNVSNQFGILMPNKKLNRWESHEHLYVSNTGISPYIRFITDEIPTLKPPTVPVQNYGAAGITKYSQFKNNSTNLSVGFLGVNAGKTKTEGSSNLLNDFMDINGDGFPDIIGSKIQLTAKRGGLSNRVLNVDFNSRTSINGSGMLVGGGNSGIKGSAAIGSASNGSLNLVVGNQGSASVNGSSFTTTNKVDRFYVDINGDGLIDIVENNGKILLNYGGTFLTGSTWKSILPFQESVTVTKGGGVGGGFSGLSNMDISGGISISGSTSKDKVSYMDINGDGLPEKIINETTYYINLGTSFDTTAKTLPGAPAQKSTEAGLNGNVTICVYFPTIFLIGPKFCVSLGGNAGKSISSEEARYMDFDGDGFTDYVTSVNNESITVYRSKVKRTNLLKTVTQSTGATIELDYDIVNPIDKSVIGSTYKMPYKKWALTKVSVFDGFVGDGENTSHYAYEYFNGYKDRKERSFLGFGMTKAHLLNKTGVVYRTDVTEYLNNDMTDDQLYRPGISSDLKQFIYKKGLPKRTYTLDRSKRMLNETVYAYKFYDSTKLTTDVNTTTTSAAEVKVYTEKLSVLPLVTSIKSKVINFDEDAQNSSFTQNTEQRFSIYDKFGNVKKYLDVNRGLTVDLQYLNGIKVLPISHRVSITSNDQTLRMTKAIFADGIQISELQKYTTTTNYIKWNYEYDQLGNLTKKIFPLQNGVRFFYEYGYSSINSNGWMNYNVRQVFPNLVKDFYGNETHFKVDAFGKPIKVVDVYQVETDYKYDQLNRLLEVKGPYESLWTIKNEYINNKIAISKHNIGNGDILHTSMINDGLGRTVQVKKEILVTEQSPDCGGQFPKVRLAVSGDILYDEFGRVVENYLSEEQTSCTNGASLRTLLTSYYMGPRIPEKKVSKLYDNKDRVVEELVFGTNAKTKTKYAFGQDYFGKTAFTQEVTLPEGNKSISYTNEFGLQTSQKQIGSDNLWTRFTYDLLGQVKTVTNAMDHVSSYNYDILGRVTNKTLAASGLTKYKYDDLGNVIEKQDANGSIVKYTYDFNRLIEIVNPTIQTEFVYDQGGRLQVMQDKSGFQEFTYGKLGEVIEDLKMLKDANGVKQYFRTKYKYDSWGRILEMVYPDNERLIYSYNRVGQLNNISRDGDEIYLDEVKYTHFDQPYYMRYGNGVEMRQEFDLVERLRASQLSSPESGNWNNQTVFSRNVYGFDKNNNIIGQRNDFSQHESIVVGGTSKKSYVYDEFNRLKSAFGEWDGLLEAHNYELQMSYMKDHSIARKIQSHLLFDKNVGSTKHTENFVKRDYQYNDVNKPQLTSIEGIDGNGQPYDQLYSYLPNGNIQSIHNPSAISAFIDRNFEWDANNNITRIEDDGQAGNVVNEYIYDGKGERVIKRLQGGNSVSINGSNPQNGMYGMDEVLYPSGNLVYSTHLYTKHYYANGKRIASKIEGVHSNPAYNFTNPQLNQTDVSPHEGSQQKGIKKGVMSGVDATDMGAVSQEVRAFLDGAICKRQIDMLLNVLYNSAETIDCKNDILAILERYTFRVVECVLYGTSPSGISMCLKWNTVSTFIDYCLALEDINKLVCVKRTPNGDIIDPITGYIYNPLTGLPYDPITGLPIDMGNGNDYDRLELDCYNKFINFIEYYHDKANKPPEYFLFVKYLKCFVENLDECFGLGPAGKPEVVIWDKNRRIDIKFCELDIPDLPVDPGVPPVVDPVFPPETLNPGIDDDIWTDNPPQHTDLVADPMSEDGPVWWYHGDHLGSSSYITDILGKPCQYIEYLPFGEIMVQQSTNNIFENVYKFNGKELDESTGYYYYGARYYDPGASIFLSVDPLAEKYPGYNPYVYVMNNPINAIDPDGKEVVFVIGGTRYNFNGTNLTNKKGQIVNVKASSHAGRILNAYVSLGKLDPHFKGQISTLVGSKNTHMINTDQLSASGGSVTGGNEFDSASTTTEMAKTGKSMGSITKYDFSETKSKEFERSTGVSNSDITTVAHELQHQYDNEMGNMADSYGMESSNINPAEIRGVNNENIARDKLKMDQRTKYGGKEINPKELKK